jgi:dTDP-glucose 4,6-dehydratase
MAVELLEKGNFGEVYNMGSEDGIKMYDLARLIGKLMDKEVTVVTDQARVRPWEIWHLQSDNTKLYSTISYRPQVSLEEGLKKVIADYKKYGFCF